MSEGGDPDFLNKVELNYVMTVTQYLVCPAQKITSRLPTLTEKILAINQIFGY
jgi:hypothetical protein